MPKKIILALRSDQPSDTPLSRAEETIRDIFFEHPSVEATPLAELGNTKPDIVLEGANFSTAHRCKPDPSLLTAVYVMITTEALQMQVPKVPRVYDWLFSFHPTNKRNFQSGDIFYLYTLLYPDFARKYNFYGLKNEPKTKFCHFVYRNPNAVERILFAEKLMQYKKVDCGGRSLNNCPRIKGKNKDPILCGLDRMQNYKFGIAFENHFCVHYTTEKIFRCFLTGTIPIYWGNPRVSELINPESFINCHDYNSFDAVIRHIAEVDNNPELYARYLNAPPILPSSPLMRSGREFLKQRVSQICDSVGKIRPISTSPLYPIRWRIWSSRSRHYLRRNISGSSRQRRRKWSSSY